MPKSGRRSSDQPGSQTVDRAITLLKQIASAPPDGLRLMDLAELTGLDRSTTYRLISTLVQHNFVEQDLSSKRYALGLEFFALASAASNRYDLSEKAREVLTTLVDGTSDTACYCLRSGNALTCIEVVTGSHQLPALAMDIGSHRPVWAGATGVALLAAMLDDEIAFILDGVDESTPGFDRKTVEAQIVECRNVGYALALDDRQGLVYGLALALVARNGRPIGTLTINGEKHRFAKDRIAGLAALLREQGQRLDRSLRQLPEAERKRNMWRGLHRERAEGQSNRA
ncbi:MAG: IclR family transcriptional regulator [Alphaproteobacteria bacterium]|nr:IclR family transcriptional regulator [Alphaproteobacteria bacterium]